MLAAQQHVEKHTQRVDVRGGGDLSVGKLLRCRVLRGERRTRFARERARRGDARIAQLRVSVEQFGNPEIEQLDLASDADEHIRRFDVSVHDQVCVGVGDGLQHVEEETDARLDFEPQLVAMAIDGLPVDMLEDQVWLSAGRDARVNEASDVRVRPAWRGQCPRVGSAPRRRGPGARGSAA